eukprot:gene9400-biopygen12216
MCQPGRPGWPSLPGRPVGPAGPAGPAPPRWICCVHEIHFGRDSQMQKSAGCTRSGRASGRAGRGGGGGRAPPGTRDIRSLLGASTPDPAELCGLPLLHDLHPPPSLRWAANGPQGGTLGVGGGGPGPQGRRRPPYRVGCHRYFRPGGRGGWPAHPTISTSAAAGHTEAVAGAADTGPQKPVLVVPYTGCRHLLAPPCWRVPQWHDPVDVRPRLHCRGGRRRRKPCHTGLTRGPQFHKKMYSQIPPQGQLDSRAD